MLGCGPRWGNRSKEHEASGGAEKTDEGGTMEGGRLTNKAGMLLKNLGNGEAMCIIAIAKPSPKPKPAPEGQIIVAPAKKVKTTEQNHYVT